MALADLERDPKSVTTEQRALSDIERDPKWLGEGGLQL
jgi:hypothetical protein